MDAWTTKMVAGKANRPFLDLKFLMARTGALQYNRSRNIIIPGLQCTLPPVHVCGRLGGTRPRKRGSQDLGK